MNICFILVLLYIIAAWKWGDWRNWKLYYPTILFMIIGDLLYQYLFHDYSMWEFVPIGIEKNWGFNHTFFSFMAMIIKYPSTVLIFLGKLPKTWSKRVAWIVLWIMIYAFSEWLKLLQGSMIHEHGWNMNWSILFNIVMFTLLIVHFKRPLSAWVFSILFILFLMKAHDIPTAILK